MPEFHPSQPAIAAIPPGVLVAAPSGDFDYPIGCECADPSLHIEQWRLETAAATEAN